MLFRSVSQSRYDGQEEVRPEPTMDSRSIMTLEMDDMIQNMDDILGNIQSGIRK